MPALPEQEPTVATSPIPEQYAVGAKVIIASGRNQERKREDTITQVTKSLVKVKYQRFYAAADSAAAGKLYEYGGGIWPAHLTLATQEA